MVILFCYENVYGYIIYLNKCYITSIANIIPIINELFIAVSKSIVLNNEMCRCNLQKGQSRKTKTEAEAAEAGNQASIDKAAKKVNSLVKNFVNLRA